MKNSSHYTLSISDLLMGFLFIFILILLKFIIDYHDKKNALSIPLIERAELLKSLKKKIEKKDISVKVDLENGILTLPEILCFQKSKYNLSEEQQKGLKAVIKALAPIICYSNLNSEEMKQRWKRFYNKSFEKKKCNKYKNKQGLIDTILVEGHADSTPIGSYFGNTCIITNLDLAQKRSQNVFKFLLQYKEPTRKNPIPEGNYLYALVNQKEKSLFGVTSYGNLRSPDQRNNKKSGSLQEKDRCINIRFIMSRSDDLQAHLKKKLKQEKQHE